MIDGKWLGRCVFCCLVLCGASAAAGGTPSFREMPAPTQRVFQQAMKKRACVMKVVRSPMRLALSYKGWARPPLTLYPQTGRTLFFYPQARPGTPVQVVSKAQGVVIWGTLKQNAIPGLHFRHSRLLSGGIVRLNTDFPISWVGAKKGAFLLSFQSKQRYLPASYFRSTRLKQLWVPCRELSLYARPMKAVRKVRRIRLDLRKPIPIHADPKRSHTGALWSPRRRSLVFFVNLLKKRGHWLRIHRSFGWFSVVGWVDELFIDKRRLAYGRLGRGKRGGWTSGIANPLRWTYCKKDIPLYISKGKLHQRVGTIKAGTKFQRMWFKGSWVHLNFFPQTRLFPKSGFHFRTTKHAFRACHRRSRR